MFRFPLWLGLWGAVLPVATLIEGIVPLFFLTPGPSLTPGDYEQLFEFWKTSAKYGVLVGFVMGLITIGVCLLRRGRAGSTHAKRFELNLRWCLIMALSLIVINDALFFSVGKTTGWPSPGTSSWLIALAPMILAGIFNFVAVVWAIVRTIGSDDILTPRVLMAKLRRSVRVEG